MSSKNLLTIDELSQVSGLSKRTIRYYVNSGLLDRPTGETKNARYDASHLEQIRNVKALQEQGYTLARIVELKRQTHQEVLNRREIGTFDLLMVKVIHDNRLPARRPGNIY